ncbi:EF-P 5-aminopentanol modification-associated protein YfmH [Clostridium sp.]|uniref:EF-P 5-aminopentanol modification-associated protein YfmH n=1 Tax=Clostridium sp. TaxID=1506 RepID=UPI002FCC2A60
MKIKKSNIEKYFQHTTPSGLKVSFIKRENASSFHMAMLVNYGGVDTEFISNGNEFVKTPRGIAHFLEHKMFESKNKDTFERFSKQSGSINAYTNATATVYYFSCTDRIEDNIRLFFNCLQSPYITKENTEKEKGIITQEINMYKDNPFAKVYDNMLKGMYHKNPVRYDVAGEASDINEITYEMLIKCFETFYTSSNMELFVVGQIDENELFEFIDSIDKFKSGGKTFKIYPSEQNRVRDSLIDEHMEVVDTNFLLGFKQNTSLLKGREILKKDATFNMLMEYLSGNMSSLYERLYSEGYIDQSFGYGVNLHSKFGFNVIGGISKSPEYVRDAFLNEVSSFINNGIEVEEFNSVKKMMLGSYTRIFDDSFSLLNNIITARNKGGCFLEITDIAKSIEIEDVFYALKDGFGEECMILSKIVPIGDKKVNKN